MNKQYVLIQEYPGSPTIGTKAKESTDYTSYYVCDNNLWLHKTDVENHPKYWQAMLCVPIGTKFKVKGEPNVYTIDMNEDVNKVTVRWGVSGSTNYLVKQVNEHFVNGDWKVIEDGVKEGGYITFLRGFDGSKAGQTVKITCIKEDTLSTNGWIEYLNPKRYPNEGGFRWASPNLMGYLLGTDFRLATPEEIAATKPLFTTEDGKEIYKGDSWWYVIPSKLVCKETNTTTYKGKNTSNDEIKTFSTEKLAQDYLALYKPLLSFSEIEGSLNFLSDEKHFKELVIQRNKC